METFTSALKYNQKVTDETDQFRDGGCGHFLGRSVTVQR